MTASRLKMRVHLNPKHVPKKIPETIGNAQHSIHIRHQIFQKLSENLGPETSIVHFRSLIFSWTSLIV
jgi:hypothetical protein